MKEPFRYKILSALLMMICKLTGHEYGCCNNVFKRCSRCEVVKAEEEYLKELGDDLHYDALKIAIEALQRDIRP